MKTKNCKEILKYGVMFLLFFLCLQFFYSCFQGDQIYNFGFSYAISRGEVPYRDFNMIITPFGTFFYFIPFIFGKHLLIFNLFQAFMLCLMFYYLFKLYGQKTWILFILLFFPYPIPFPTLMFQGYNFLLLFGLILLLYLEKKKANDYLIGFIIGLCFLTKQTVGFALALPSFYYLFSNKDYKKVFKRAGAFLSINIVFVIYLLITKSFGQFIDFCFLGMFDFTKSNGTIFDVNFIVFLIEIICIFVFIIKDRKNINNYYVLAFSMISIPLFDYYHVALFTYACFFLLIEKISFTDIKRLEFCSFMFVTAICLSWFLLFYNFKVTNLSYFNGFEFKLMNKKVEKNTKEMVNYIDSNKDKNIIILSANAYFFKIVAGRDINYYDLLNYGNHGYNGTNKVIKSLKKEKDPIFIINIKEYEDNSSDRQQINKVVIKYVLDNYKLITTKGEYVIYGEN
jgi:hypothetical protein